LQRSVDLFFFHNHLYKTLEIETIQRIELSFTFSVHRFSSISACVYPDIYFTVFQGIQIVNDQISTRPEGKDQVILVSLSTCSKLLLRDEDSVKQSSIFDVNSTKMTTLEAKKTTKQNNPLLHRLG